MQCQQDCGKKHCTAWQHATGLELLTTCCIIGVLRRSWVGQPCDADGPASSTVWEVGHSRLLSACRRCARLEGELKDSRADVRRAANTLRVGLGCRLPCLLCGGFRELAWCWALSSSAS